MLQVEACPFHSHSLPNKAALLVDLQRDPLLRQYLQYLRAFLIDRPVVIVSAVSSRGALVSEMQISGWLASQAEVA